MQPVTALVWAAVIWAVLALPLGVWLGWLLRRADEGRGWLAAPRAQPTTPRDAPRPSSQRPEVALPS